MDRLYAGPMGLPLCHSLLTTMGDTWDLLLTKKLPQKGQNFTSLTMLCNIVRTAMLARLLALKQQAAMLWAALRRKTHGKEVREASGWQPEGTKVLLNSPQGLEAANYHVSLEVDLSLVKSQGEPSPGQYPVCSFTEGPAEPCPDSWPTDAVTNKCVWL